MGHMFPGGIFSPGELQDFSASVIKPQRTLPASVEAQCALMLLDRSTPLSSYRSSSLSESDSNSYSRPAGNSAAEFQRTFADIEAQTLADSGLQPAADSDQNLAAVADNAAQTLADSSLQPAAESGLNPAADQNQATKADKTTAQYLELLDLEDENSTDRMTDSTYVPSSTGNTSALVRGKLEDKEQQRVDKDTTTSKPSDVDDRDLSDSSHSSEGSKASTTLGKIKRKIGKRRTSQGKR